MARTHLHLAAEPIRPRSSAVRHVEAFVRPRASRAVQAFVLACGLFVPPGAHAAELAPDVPPSWTPFVETGPTALPPAPEPASPADLNLVWFDPAGALPAGYEGVTREVSAIFQALGVEVSWRVGGTFGDGSVPEVPVILLPRDPLGRRRSEQVLGLVVRDQEPHRAVWVFEDSVRRVLRLPAGDDASAVAPLARALGRVVAHEVVHAIAPDVPHARKGLMRHAFDRSFLLGRRTSIDPECAAAFVTELAALAQARSPRSAFTAYP